MEICDCNGLALCHGQELYTCIHQALDYVTMACLGQELYTCTHQALDYVTKSSVSVAKVALVDD